MPFGGLPCGEICCYKRNTNDNSFVVETSSPFMLIILLSIINTKLRLCDKVILGANLIVNPYYTLHSRMMVNRNAIFTSGWKYDELLVKNIRFTEWV
jgi:hypothetical protein